MEFIMTLRISLARTLAVLALLGPASAFASVDELDEAGETTLQTTQNSFDIRVRNVTDVGNSVRVEIRPRNGNCVTANDSKVTWSGFTALDGMPMYQGGVTDVAWGITLHDNPMCTENKWGWYSIDDLQYTYGSGTYATTIHGTLKSYKVEITVQDNYNKTGKRAVTKLRTN